MSRSTVDFGIDLGTTNSEIGVFRGAGVEMIANREGRVNTASAVWIDAKGRKFVGRDAREMSAQQPWNAKVEFKRQMGKDIPWEFRDGRLKLLPEQLSAEVLLQLKADVQRQLHEELRAAVITVPAGFSGPATAATNRAAQLAGLEAVWQLQEPIAAATAYGFADRRDSNSVRWLVYDLGGGTFDAALVRKVDGTLAVENHGGDDYLGGKDLDEAIVHQLLLPELRKRTGFDDFGVNDERWRAVWARLKFAAEEAK